MNKITQKSIQNINNQASRVLSKAKFFFLVWVVTDKFQSMHIEVHIVTRSTRDSRVQCVGFGRASSVY